MSYWYENRYGVNNGKHQSLLTDMIIIIDMAAEQNVDISHQPALSLLAMAVDQYFKLWQRARQDNRVFKQVFGLSPSHNSYHMPNGTTGFYTKFHDRLELKMDQIIITAAIEQRLIKAS